MPRQASIARPRRPRRREDRHVRSRHQSGNDGLPRILDVIQAKATRGRKMRTPKFVAILGFAAAVATGRAGPPKPTISKELAARAQKLIDADPKSEAARMADACLKGSQLGPGDGWFGAPPEAAYNWKWLAKRH